MGCGCAGSADTYQVIYLNGQAATFLTEAEARIEHARNPGSRLIVKKG